MKETRLYVIILIIVFIITGTMKLFGQSFYANRYDKGRTTQLNSKSVAQKRQLTVYHKHSNLYKIRREISHSKKRKNFKRAKHR